MEKVNCSSKSNNQYFHVTNQLMSFSWLTKLLITNSIFYFLNYPQSLNCSVIIDKSLKSYWFDSNFWERSSWLSFIFHPAHFSANDIVIRSLLNLNWGEKFWKILKVFLCFLVGLIISWPLMPSNERFWVVTHNRI